jgi:hypothetical protein
MSKIFKRPMFRKGGSTSGMNGIMTGIVDREMHAASDPDGVGGQSLSTAERLQKISDQYPDRSIDPIAQLLIQGGLGAMSTTGGGGTFGNIAKAFKDPTTQLFKDLGERGKRERDLALQGEILDIEGDVKKDVAGIQQKGALDIRIGKLDQLYNIKRKNAAGNQTLLDQIEKDYQRDFRDAVQGLDESDLYGVLKNTVVQEALMDNARSYVENNMKIDQDDPKYGATVSAVLAKLSKKYISDLRSNNANGGRIGYGEGTPPAMHQGMNQTPINVGSQEVSDPKVEITYEELRARLPEEINNEVVQMLSTSYEALADFAELRTQADVDTFNSKYGVTLVLPQEA